MSSSREGTPPTPKRIAKNSAQTFGHFGQTGTFIWADPEATLALVVLTDRDFGQWALPIWPALADTVISECLTD